MIVVYGAIVAEPDGFEELRREGLAHTHRSRTEDGCILHSLHTDVESPLRLVFVEKWRDRAALDEHFKQAGSLAFMRVVRRLNKGSEAMEIWEV